MPDAVQERGERRVDAWRRSIALFDKTTHDEGPFHAAGYSTFVLEPRTEEGLTPDIIAASSERFVICDISISPSKNVDGLRRYANSTLTPYLRTRLGTSSQAVQGSVPFYLTPERNLRDFPADINAIQLVSPYDTHAPNVGDARLRAAVVDWPGFQRPPPNYSLLAVPESDLAELKYPVAGILKQRAVSGDPVRPSEIAHSLLGDRAADFPAAALRGLTDKVATLLGQAAAHLGEYARWDRSTKTLTFSDPQTLFENTSARIAVANRIATWVGTPFIEQFGGLDEDDDENGDE